MRKRLEASITARGEKRSVRAPPTNMNKALGTPAKARTAPTARASPVNCSTNHGKAIR